MQGCQTGMQVEENRQWDLYSLQLQPSDSQGPAPHLLVRCPWERDSTVCTPGMPLKR